MPLMPVLGRSLLYVYRHWVANSCASSMLSMMSSQPRPACVRVNRLTKAKVSLVRNDVVSGGDCYGRTGRSRPLLTPRHHRHHHCEGRPPGLNLSCWAPPITPSRLAFLLANGIVLGATVLYRGKSASWVIFHERRNMDWRSRLAQSDCDDHRSGPCHTAHASSRLLREALRLLPPYPTPSFGQIADRCRPRPAPAAQI